MEIKKNKNGRRMDPFLQVIQQQQQQGHTQQSSAAFSSAVFWSISA